MDLSGKVALVTGGARGIGKGCVEELLKNGVKGITIADINATLGETTAKELNDTYGKDKVIFVQTDVSKKESFENAFQKTVDRYDNIDILINNAGLMNEYKWENVIQVNLVGTTNGCVLAIEKYFPKYKSGTNTYIINLSSISGITPVEFCPHYNATKHAIIGLTRTYGMNRHLKKEGIHVMALCPAGTDTAMGDYMRDVVLYKDVFDELMAHFNQHQQKVNAVGQAAIQAMKDSDSGSAWYVCEGVAHKVKFPTLEQLI